MAQESQLTVDPQFSDEPLSELLSEFARTMITDFPIQAILDRLVERIVGIMPVTAAGVTLISPDAEIHYVAASDSAALRYERLQSELGEGPCLDAYRSGVATIVEDLRLDTRFPRFAPRAVQEGLVAVFTFPLRHREGRLGALDLYRSTPGPLAPSTMRAAQTLADVAAAYLINAQTRADLIEMSVRSRESSLHDPLTGLPNRVLFLERLEQAVARSARTGKMLAVLFADLDKFKAVNDQYGHSAGDELLVAVARRMVRTLRPDDTMGRLSGDEFVVLCEDLTDLYEVEAIAARVGAALRAPFGISGAVISLSASVGIAFSGHADQRPEQILHQADSAMYRAKRNGGARHEVLDLRQQPPVGRGTGLAFDLGRAVRRNELWLDYQPIVDAMGTHVLGVEALVRWAHPDGGSIAPATFIPLAEQSGLIPPIGRWVLERACRDGQTWKEADGDVALGIWVNVSVHELMSPNFAAAVSMLLTDTHTDPASLTFEVTESAFIRDGERALAVLNALKALGVSLALDDFGTGYSSLSHLSRFPIDVVKIDRSFVAAIGTDTTSEAIVAAVIGLAHTLGMRVVGEGIETAAQHETLVALGCDYLQGYHFARPVPVDALPLAIASVQGADPIGSAQPG